MIQGRSNFVYRYIGEGATGNLYISYNLIDNPEYKDKVQPIHVDVNIVHNDVLDIHAFRAWMPVQKCSVYLCRRHEQRGGRQSEYRRFYA